jgi:hypothetical protein
MVRFFWVELLGPARIGIWGDRFGGVLGAFRKFRALFGGLR